jgi:hypothetical protein
MGLADFLDGQKEAVKTINWAVAPRSLAVSGEITILR